MEEQFELRSLENSDAVHVAFVDAKHTVSRQALSRSPVLAQVLRTLDDLGPSGTVKSHAPKGLLAAWLQHNSQESELTCTDTQTLVEFLKVCFRATRSYLRVV